MRIGTALGVAILAATACIAACSGGAGGDPDGSPGGATGTAGDGDAGPGAADATPMSPGPGATAEATAVAQLATYPGDVRTGVLHVDAVIEALLAGDLDALASLMSWREVTCVGADEATAENVRPVCPEGVEPGAGVRAIAFAACEGAFVAEPFLPQGLAALYDPEGFGGQGRTEPLQLFAAAEARPRTDWELIRPVRYVLALTLEGPVGRWVYLDDRGIVALEYGCGLPEPPRLAGDESDRFEVVSYLLPPL